jgi:hypothetical protein
VLAHILIGAILASQGDWTFESDVVGRIPKRWETRGNSDRPVYQVKADPDGNHYLAADSRGSDVQLGIELEAEPRAQPLKMLSWRWRISSLPSGADERKSKTLDSAASVYAVFGSRLLPRILKYVWSTSVPAGHSFKHPNSGRMVIIVVNTGPASLGQWQSVSRDLAADYRAAFGSSAPRLIAIGVKTDSDSTGTSARADYDDIRLTR